jgi:predicted AlkP superfamily phosphohydrolase/phosphomutase
VYLHDRHESGQRRHGSYGLEVTNASMIGAPTLFGILSNKGHRVAAINVPFTYPPHPINGIMVSGAFAPSINEKAVHPPNFYSTISRLVPGYSAMLDYEPLLPDALATYADRLLTTIEQRQRLALHVLKREQWSLLAVVFMATDWAQHAFWKFHESADARYGCVIRDVYQRVDTMVGTLVEAIDEQTVVFVISDHGAGPLKCIVNLNRWLAQAGFLHYRDSAASPFRTIRERALKRLARAYRRYLRPELRAAIRTQMGSQRFEKLKGQMESTLFASTIDWSRTRAYSLGAGGNLFLNLAGREPQGTVQPGAEYERLLREIADALLLLRAPDTGQRLVKRVYRREELYAGRFLEQAPDLVIEWMDYAYWGRGRYDVGGDQVFEYRDTFDLSDLPLSSSHRTDGILIASGPGIRPGTRISGARLVDLAPTVLSLLDIAAPAQMDGRILWELLADDEAVRRQQVDSEVDMDVASQPFGFSPEESEEIAEHLRGLGYL